MLILELIQELKKKINHLSKLQSLLDMSGQLPEYIYSKSHTSIFLWFNYIYTFSRF